MKLLYLDCFSGISGDMLLGAFLHAGLEQSVLEDVVKSLGLTGVRIDVSKESRCGIQGTQIKVHCPSKQSERCLQDILKLLEKANLSPAVRNNAQGIFQTLAQVEAKIHGTTPEEVHFHEVGAVDSLVDIVGACAGLEALKIQEVYASSIPLGSGLQKTSHGQLPMPGPATLELLKGAQVVVDSREGELVTPTGAAFLKQFCKGYGRVPEMIIQAVGYGVGSRNLDPYPNLLRMVIGETAVAKGEDEVDTVSILETNIDDMNPQVLGSVFDLLMEEGALDVYLTSIQMKGSRSGVKLSVICPLGDQSRLAHLIFDQTTTLGIRILKTDRIKLRREIVQVQTEYGPVPVKVGYQDGKISTLSPEYKVLKELADRSGRPLKEIYFKALSEAQRKFLGWK